MKRTLDVDPARCTRCHGRFEPIAIITRDEIISRILSHLRLPSAPAPLGPAGSLAYDVTGEPMGDWVVGVDPTPPDQGPRFVRSTRCAREMATSRASDAPQWLRWQSVNPSLEMHVRRRFPYALHVRRRFLCAAHAPPPMRLAKALFSVVGQHAAVGRMTF